MYYKQVSFDITLLKWTPLLQNCIWSHYDLDLWPRKPGVQVTV